MTYRAHCEGRKGRRGRRWKNLFKGTPQARTSPLWVLVLGDYKTSDRAMNEHAERLHEALKEQGVADDE